MNIIENDYNPVSLCGEIPHQYKYWYLLTIGKSQKKEIVDSKSLQEVLNMIKYMLGERIHVYEWVEEFGTVYHQRHLHCVVGSSCNIKFFFRYTKLLGFRLHWKHFNYIALYRVRHYIRKDYESPKSVQTSVKKKVTKRKKRMRITTKCTDEQLQLVIDEIYRGMIRSKGRLIT